MALQEIAGRIAARLRRLEAYQPCTEIPTYTMAHAWKDGDVVCVAARHYEPELRLDRRPALDYLRRLERGQELPYTARKKKAAC